MKLLLAICVAVSGCASNGVVMTDEEKIACRTEGCIPFTEAELIQFRDKALNAGYQRGWHDAHRQAGRAI